MDEARGVSDQPQRERALDPRHSFIVQAPAGSGKTELLIQRYLALLACVERPEQIAAITFTRKAAAEMRSRVLDAMSFARTQLRPGGGHKARTWDLARAVVERDARLGWRLENARERLRVQTIDALCASLARQMPVVSRFGAPPAIVEKAEALYAEAARNTVAALQDARDRDAEALELLLRHVDNDAFRAEQLLAGMLAKRDQWMPPLAREEHMREALEAAIGDAVAQAVSHARTLATDERVPGIPPHDDPIAWMGFANALLVKGGEWRSRPAGEPYAANARLRHALRRIQKLPPARYTDEQWAALGAIRRALLRAAAELLLVFARRGQVDFIELSQAASRSLETEEGPTDLLLALDYRIHHILVDEFQDTSSSQLELLRKLTSGWEPGDGRTLFVVGDPMQSIYRFRHAEVALFLAAQRDGIGSVPLEALTLSANFRSQAGVVEWVNATFPAVMAPRDDLASGAVRYAPSEPVHARDGVGVVYHAFDAGDGQAEAAQVLRLIAEGLEQPARDGGKPSTVAVLVRSRTHLESIVAALDAAELRFRAIEIEPLGHRPVVRDLFALTRAIVHLADRTAWLAILRAPWCGLTLDDLHAIAASAQPILWETLVDDFALHGVSADGLERIVRLREALAPSIGQRRRSTLRAAVETAWLALAGPACVELAADLDDADIYLDFLEENERAGRLEDLGAFEEGVAALFALPDPDASDRLQVMTIHRAKGLEFDTVIVPGLARVTPTDDPPLLMWLENVSQDRGAGAGLLLAPINPTGGDDDPAYAFLREIEKEKARHECERLLYVAATRARRRLHLLACLGREHDGSVKDPPGGSLLARLWPAIGPRFAECLATPNAAVQPRKAPAIPPSEMLRRLARPVAIPPMPPLAWSMPPQGARERAQIEFSWVGETARRVGSVVHRWLQAMAGDALRGWSVERVNGLAAAIRAELRQAGVAEAELDNAARSVQRALANTLEDPRGRWLLGPHRRAKREHRITAIVDGTPRALVIDRFFEDDEGNAWIVDYKTSAHEGGDLERFLAEEERRYRAQLEQYAGAMPGRVTRLGLYFPLLRAWREWRTELEAMEP